jgi:hypothetical protein
MLIPSKHEKLDNNVLVLGADLLGLLKRKSYNVESLFQDAKHVKALSLDQYYNTLTFLWSSGLIELQNHQVIIKS